MLMINRLHHWISVKTRKFLIEGSTYPVGNEASFTAKSNSRQASSVTGSMDHRLVFQYPLNTNDGFYIVLIFSTLGCLFLTSRRISVARSTVCAFRALCGRSRRFLKFTMQSAHNIVLARVCLINLVEVAFR